ncbi:Response regulator receiver domain-containing protein [Neorhodopirellula lusitana]|uniref:Response regulator receiver domain-containing protein n=1 Tax=Neorhodopirellula lusitana TaxID=445327 RepID=A0ABY1QIG6_9BACT|nr:response regulator [Neorhodopirellula lusitana]SMP69530.1 Response regulator receiver domain-containing protein [Neorhodopirellula lusitana]
MTRRLRLVIADDEDDIRQGLSRLLDKLGYEVVADASNGRELVELCRKLVPDLVLTDIRMPFMSGIQAANELSKTHAIPFIVMSSFERPNDEELDCKSVADYLVKPVRVPDLQLAISRASIL